MTNLAAALGAALLLTACGADDPEAGATDDTADVGDEAAEDDAAQDDADDEAAGEDGVDPADDTTDAAQDEAADADEDDEPAGADEAGDGGEDDGAAADAPSGGTLDGELVVGGTAYDPQEAIVCEDDGAFPMDVELEYQAFAEGPDGRGQLDILISELGADASWSGEEGVFGDGLSNSDITFTGDRVSGTATVTDALGSEETLDISFDLAVPSTTIACRG